MARKSPPIPRRNPMAILQSKTKADPIEIPPQLRRAPNGAAKPSYEELLAQVAALQGPSRQAIDAQHEGFGKGRAQYLWHGSVPRQPLSRAMGTPASG